MTRYEKLDVSFEIRRFVTQTQLLFTIRRSAIVNWCLGLTLLRHHMIEKYIVAEPNDRSRLSVAWDPQLPVSSRAMGVLSESRSEATLTTTELDHWLGFFLELYRDGVASVTHIDLDLQSEPDDMTLTLTLQVEDAREPVSEDEARRRLGLPKRRHK